MSDIISQEIDPKHPWIVDPADTPSDINWMQTLTNPFGETSRVHFTRAWTGLFFVRLIYAIAIAILVFIFSSAGAEDPRALVPPVGTFHLIVLVTALASLVAHIRRLTNARRSPFWAVLVIVPVLIGFVGFIAGAGQAGQQYTIAAKAAELRGQGMAERDIVKELGLVKTPSESADTPEAATGEPTGANNDATSELASADGESAEAAPGAGQGRQMGPRNLIPQIDVTEVSQREHALKGGLATAQIFWAVPSFLVMLWTLLWVGRLPNGGGTIKERLRSEPTTYEEQASS